MIKNFNHIISNPNILNGKPCISGTRISVDIILEWLATGATIQEIVKKFNYLSEEAVRQAIMYASNFLHNEIIIEVEDVA